MPKETIFIRSGDTVDHFQIILEGKVSIFDPYDEDGHDGYAGSSALIGDIRQLTGQKALLSCKVVEPGRML